MSNFCQVKSKFCLKMSDCFEMLKLNLEISLSPFNISILVSQRWIMYNQTCILLSFWNDYVKLNGTYPWNASRFEDSSIQSTIYIQSATLFFQAIICCTSLMFSEVTAVLGRFLQNSSLRFLYLWWNYLNQLLYVEHHFPKLN